ncbi:MAG: alpha/beta fold hydrolase [Parachlamydiaceae bacterium]|nr:alpha/beta fold hydrolase [Parachlamydiaceae bacterium]
MEKVSQIPGASTPPHSPQTSKSVCYPVAKRIFEQLGGISYQVALCAAVVVIVPLELLAAVVVTVLIAAAIIIASPWFLFSNSKHKTNALHNAQAVIRELFATAVITAMYPFELTSRNDYSPTKKTPMIFVHGYLHNSSGWRVMVNRLKAAGIDNPMFFINLGSPLQLMEQYNESLEKEVAKIMDTTGASQVIWVGHSMGGLLGASYVQKHKEKVKTLITIGSPLEGTKMAVLGFGRCSNQMKNGSDYIKKLKATPHETPSLCFWSKQDAAIFPRWSAKGPKTPQTNSQLLDKHGHLSMFFSRKLCNQLIAHLQQQK